MAAITIEKYADDDVGILVLKGEFESEQVDEFLGAVEELIEKGLKAVVVNMRVVRFINSTAVRAVIRAKNRLAELGGELVISHPSAFVSQVASTLGLGEVIRIHDEDKDAVLYFRRKEAEESGIRLIEEKKSTVLFTFEEDERTRALGRPFGVGKFSFVGEHHIRFEWAQPQEGSARQSAEELAQLFEAGSAVHLKFRLPLYKRSYYFEIPGRVRTAVVDREGRVTVEADFLKVSEEDQKHLKQYVTDVGFIGRELGE